MMLRLATVYSDLYSRKELPVVDELVLPISVTPGQSAIGATATDVNPPNVVAILIKRYADGNLKRIVAAVAPVILQLSSFQILVAVSNWMLVAANSTDSHSCA